MTSKARKQSAIENDSSFTSSGASSDSGSEPAAGAAVTAAKSKRHKN